MKKGIKRFSMGLAALVLFIIAAVAIYAYKANAELRNMHSVETKEVVNQVFALQDAYVNMYLIQDDSNYIAVDAGNDRWVVEGAMKKLNIDPDKVVAVLLTHTDADHTAALSLFRNAKAYLSQQEEKLLTGEKTRFLFFGNKIDAKEYTLIRDEAIFHIGKTKIKGLLMPGHTFGSMSFLINDKYLFVGDALGLKDGKIVPFPTLFNTDSKTALKSMSNIIHLPTAEYIFTAHYGYTDDYKNAVKEWKE
ncbi:MAG: MBL fold metallo-hydrolase [Bacteroidales bacterium]|nr:MBL fold metallo-hydrolase [Bacteroidales bacterium]